MRNVLLIGVAMTLAAATVAEATPRRGGFAPYGRIQGPQPIRPVPGPPEVKPFKPYKGFSIYHGDPTDLSPSRTPGYEPGLSPRPYKPFPTEGVFGPSGGTREDRRRSRF